MSYNRPISFKYRDYTGDEHNSHKIHWKVTYEDGPKIGVITYAVHGKVDTEFIRLLKSKGAVYI